jgi:hypothetical protein
LLPLSATIGSKINILYNENLITVAEALIRHVNSFKVKYPDVDLGEDLEAIYGTDYRNMCGIYNKTRKHDPIMVLYMAITLSKEQDNGVDRIILRPSKVESENNIFRRIGFFKRGRNEYFQEDIKTEISIT